MSELKVIAFCGSLRTASHNKKLALLACDILKSKKCVSEYVDLRALDLPLFDEDLETKSGLPKGAEKLIGLINGADALVIASPEYNGGYTAALKNAIDWATRGDGNPFAKKVILVVGTSPGWWGAVKSNLALRQTLTHIGAVVVPTQVCIPTAEKSIDDKGHLSNPVHIQQMNTGCDELVRLASALKV